MQLSATDPRQATGTAALAGNRIGLADNFDSFLKLLTAQLTNQDPLAPLDANQFTQQLVQFTGVEQTIKTNSALAELVALIRAGQFASSVDYLGAEVTAPGDTVRLGAAGPAQVHYQLGAPAATVGITIRDDAGRAVWTAQGERSAGAHALAWDGRDSQGRQLPAGLYTADVTALDAAGGALPVQTRIMGVVDGVELAGERVLLSVGGVLVEPQSLVSIRRPGAGNPT